MGIESRRNLKDASPEDIDEISNNSQEKLENENGDKTYISEEIVRLNKLRNDGVLTEKEFEKAKEKLLS